MNLDSTRRFSDGRLWVLIAAYNEASVISDVIKDVLLNVTDNVLVVNDGSSDNTAEIAKAAGAQVISHCDNLGQGAALQTGFSYLKGIDFDYVVTFDADGQHMYEDIFVMMEALEKEQADIALGSRFLGRVENISKKKLLTLKAAIAFTNATSGVTLTDSHNGLRLLTARAVNEISITQRGMAHASEIIDEIYNKNLKWCEVPVTIKYTEYSVSKGQRISNSISIVLDLLINRLYK
ncbi:bacterial lipid A biosynthesis acyltransferase family [Vibrio mimicus]|uniref:glycosyltransferase family 2 protein n=1 Tax=Vibrio mimicus TaxID=674 RepID=UPI0002BA624F|nr:glycosyltransferase family 2 protein [Vibrio mimicus]EMB49866.1 glycosyl transferase family protein [Vibrio mimicus CAIM 602]MBY7675966.1 glycosyltransferase family 2 protein [Vibrio mimicus]MBY7727826.1 glycosyltransferase family 2 protein [Vibrio mimicus]TXY28808.1 glycosyltransferase family 2 protein [Vibrio mimicus]SUP15805.1 bacterial lipid A biosynthesis acyltransferase family [Vibrio mimicus]